MKNNKIIFLLGGARSGKSKFAIDLAKKSSGKVIYIATAGIKDEEMRDRVIKHRKARPKSWKTVEEEYYLDKVIKKKSGLNTTLIVDCLTLLVSNWLLKEKDSKKVLGYFEKVLHAIKRSESDIIIVSNETGMGLVPDNLLGRKFRDAAGSINQKISEISDEVFLVVAGIPIKIK